MKSSHTTITARRGGFTLIELMIVIAVIAILAGILLQAVGGATRNVYLAQTVADIKDIETGILGFQEKFSVFPPSYIVLHEESDDWLGTDPQTAVSKRAIREVFPQFSFPTATGQPDVDWNQDGTIGGTHHLNGSECLVFFLGGGRVNGTDPIDQQVYTGFSKNPVNPFTVGTTNRIKPFVELQSSRLVDTDGDNMPEYVDKYPDQTVPYVYFRALRDGVYTPAGVDGALGTDDDETPPDGPAFAYYKSMTDIDGATAGFQTTTVPAGIPYANGRFQLISPGQDGVFGIGGEYTQDGSPPIPNYAYEVSGTPLERDPNVERDNIANFAGGTLQ